MAHSHRETIHDWMFNAALPWWAANGVDRANGGFVEQVTPDGADGGIAFKRTRVTALQIYVFAHGHMLGFKPGLELANHGVDFLTSRTWNGPDKGFARRLTREGGALDSTPDLYDHAFVLFALAWHYKASGDRNSRDWMHRTLDYIETHMRVSGGEGFWHELPPKGWRQQNPHMHLTEACLAAFEATGEARFSTLAKEIIAVFEARFFDPQTQTLAEFFTEDLARAPGDDGRIVEPGHQFEWAWILNSCRKLLGVQLAPQIRALASFAEAHGVDGATKITFNSVRDDGATIDRASRTWPNTERIKAAIALHELDGIDPSPVIESSAALLFDRYLGRTLPGTWVDLVDADGKSVSGNAPASTFYHVFLAFAEVLRIS
ncbi:MAG: AGE family epimerase/isomerase [Hyphomonadaceae bacterium]|nr:AGE family epimerase/isomerase [Hyphomonadaceae bacterium]